MINLLASGLLSLCLLSPVQSPDCAGGVGASIPSPIAHLPSVSLPIPLPIPSLPLPAPVPAPVAPPIMVLVPAPVPAPVRPPVAPAAPPAAVVPVPAPVAPELPAPAVPDASPLPVSPDPTAVPPAPSPVESSPSPEPSVPAASPAPEPAPEKPKFHFPFFDNDGSFGGQVITRTAQNPDLLTLILTALVGLGFVILNNKLDTSPTPKRLPNRK